MLACSNTRAKLNCKKNEPRHEMVMTMTATTMAKTKTMVNEEVSFSIEMVRWNDGNQNSHGQIIIALRVLYGIKYYTHLRH